jgi:predicted PurR-regulated permease PerM
MKLSRYQIAALMIVASITLISVYMGGFLAEVIVLGFLAKIASGICTKLADGVAVGGFRLGTLSLKVPFFSLPYMLTLFRIPFTDVNVKMPWVFKRCEINIPFTWIKVPHLFTARMNMGLSAPILTILIPLLIVAGMGTYMVTVVSKLETLFGGFSEEALRPMSQSIVLWYESTFSGTPLERIDGNMIANFLVGVPAWVSENLLAYANKALSFAPKVVHAFIFLIMWWIATIEWKKYVAPFMVEVLHLVTPARFQDPIDRVLAGMDDALTNLLLGWVRIGITLAFIIMFVLLFAGFSLVMAVFLGLVAGFLSVVPFIGSWIALIVTLVVTFATFLNTTVFPYIVVLVGVGAVNFVLESKILTPKYVGDSLRIWKIGVILAVIAGGKLLGSMGFIAALPIVCVVKPLALEGILQLYLHKLYVGDLSGMKFFQSMLKRHRHVYTSRAAAALARRREMLKQQAPCAEKRMRRVGKLLRNTEHVDAEQVNTPAT